MNETLREHAKRIVRELAASDFADGIYRDGLRSDDTSEASDERAAVACLGSAAYTVWLAQWRACERARVQTEFPTAACLLELWEREWSSTALRNAAHRLAFVQGQGFDILEDSKPL